MTSRARSLTLASWIAALALFLVGVVAFVRHHAELQAQAAARLGAEYGIEIGKLAVSKTCEPGHGHSRLVSPSNAQPPAESFLRGQVSERARAGLPAASYEVVLLNNSDDPGFQAGQDTDFTLLLRSTGIGPHDATATIEIKLTDTLCSQN